METLTRFCVVIPTYNEASTIAKVIRGVEEAGASWVVIVDDGSRDGTIEIVKDLMKEYGNIVRVERGRKLGIGSALREGMAKALTLEPKPDAIVTMDADLSHNPSEVPKLVEACRPDVIVIGSRYVKGGAISEWGLHRRLVSSMANGIARSILGVTVRDATSGFRCYGREVAEKLVNEELDSGFFFQVEALFKAMKMGFKAVEVPVTFVGRTGGKSKLGFGEILGFLRGVWRTFLWGGEVFRIGKFCVVGLSGAGVNELVLWALANVLGINYIVSAAVSAEAAIVNNFVWNDLWTFGDRAGGGLRERVRRFARFNLSRVAGIGIGLAVLILFTEVFGIHYLISNVFAVVATFIWNYLTSMGWVW
ncbi:MAG: hypothetical protein DRO18_04290 [Thermoprotei archaeon]|nr:MAG: hypothetical protein DRO18_04290 [Thermoprotei archaeon]